MPREFGRVDRVADFLLRELSVLVRSEVRDPRVGNVTITHVKVTRDLAWADVRICCLGGADSEQRSVTVKALARAAGFLRSQLARHSTMRAMPKLRFHYDEGIDESIRMSDLIGRVRAQDDAHTDAAGDPR